MCAFRVLAVLLSAILLTGCFGDSDRSGRNQAITPEPPATRVFEGRAVKGVVRHGVLTVEQYLGGAWMPFSSGHTDADGLFVLDLNEATGPVRITITADHATRLVCDAPAGCGEAVAFGEDMAPPDDFRLTTLVPAGQGHGAIAVTPLTHLAAEWIAGLPESVQLNDALITLAMARVAQVFGVSDDFARRLPADITVDVSALTDADLTLAAVGASFSAIAYGMGANDVQLVLDLYAGEFVRFAGQLPVEVDYENGRPGLDLVHSQALALLDLVLAPGDRSALIEAFNDQFDRWAGHAVTQAGGGGAESAAAVASARVLLDDLDYYLGLAGINEQGQFLATEMEQIRWLYNSASARKHTSEMVGLVLEGALMALFVMYQGDAEAPLEDCIDLGTMPVFEGMNLAPGYARYCGGDHTVRLDGVRFGQTVDAVIALPALPLVTGSPLEMALSGHEADRASIRNGTADGELGGTLTVVVDGSPDDLLSLNGVASVSGQARLTPAGADQGFVIDLTASAGFDAAALAGEGTLLALQIDDGALVSPNLDRLWAITDSPAFCQHRLPLRLVVAPQSSLQACFAFEAFSMPEMQMTAGGTLDGLYDVVGQLLAGSDSGDLASLVSSLDLSMLVLQGDARLKVLDPLRGQREFLFALDNARLDAERVETGDTLSFHVTGLEGGYITHAGLLVATVHSDWSRLGATLRFVDDTPARSYFLGQPADVVDDDLIRLIQDSFNRVLQTLGSIL